MEDSGNREDEALGLFKEHNSDHHTSCSDLTRNSEEHHMKHSASNSTSLQNGFILKIPSVDGNLFIEQLISERLRDLVEIEPTGEIKLNMREQMSAML